MQDYLLDLLNNHRRYRAEINTIKFHECMFHDQDEYARLMRIERHLIRLEYSIEQLTVENREVIQNLYFKGFSMSQLAKARHMSKPGIQYQKEMAIRQLRTIFRAER